MKRYILIILTIFTFTGVGQAQFSADSLPPASAMDYMTWWIGRSFEKEIRRAKVPLGCKIYTIPFRCEKSGVDTFKTPLGMKLAAELSFAFKRRAQGRKMRKYNLEVVSPDNENKQLFELMARHMLPPATMSEESDMWKNAAQSQRPDYYLVGKYEIIGDYTGVRVSNVELIKDVINPKLAAYSAKITLSDADFEFQDENEKAAFRKMDGSVGSLDDRYARLVRQASRGQFATVQVVNEKTDQTIGLDTPLKLSNGYQLKVNLLQDAYVYAFYYESNDATGNKMYMIYPFEDGMVNTMKKGVFTLPDDENVFSPSAPVANQVFIKLIASKKKLPLHITTTSEGYRYLSPEDCAQFVGALEKMPAADVDSNNLIRGVVE